MRQLAILPNPDAAQTLADNLQTLQIDTRLEKSRKAPSSGSATKTVWSRLGKNWPTSPAIRPTLGSRRLDKPPPRCTARREKETEEASRSAPAANRGGAAIAPLTYGLIAASVVVFIAHTGYMINANGGFHVAGGCQDSVRTVSGPGRIYQSRPTGSFDHLFSNGESNRPTSDMYGSVYKTFATGKCGAW